MMFLHFMLEKKEDTRNKVKNSKFYIKKSVYTIKKVIEYKKYPNGQIKLS